MASDKPAPSPTYEQVLGFFTWRQPSMDSVVLIRVGDKTYPIQHIDAETPGQVVLTANTEKEIAQ